MSMDKVFEARLGEDEPLIPDGWDLNADIFAEARNSGIADPDGDTEGAGDSGVNETGDTAESAAPTTGNDTQASPQDDTTASAEATPDGEQTTPKQSRKLKLTVNHASEEVDIDAMSDEDLIALLQKGKAFDAMKESQNKARYREVYQEQIDNGMTEAVAKMVAANESDGKTYSLTDETPEPEAQQTAESKQDRDFLNEVNQLKVLYPDFKTMPNEVASAVANGAPLLTAYVAYRAKQDAKAAASAKRENQILKQNAAAAAKAPVTGVTGGGTSSASQKTNPLLDGFDSPQW